MRKEYAINLLSVWLVLASFMCPVNLWAGDSAKQAGDVLQLVLPGAAAGLTLLHRDFDGGIQLLESETLTLGVTYGLKYAVNEKRPNGGKYSFPSGHTSVSFSAAEFMRGRYGWEYGNLLMPWHRLLPTVGWKLMNIIPMMSLQAPA